MREWLLGHPRLGTVAVGAAVACAVLLLAAEHLRIQGAGAATASYYAQF
jgi:hypothetical protein